MNTHKKVFILIAIIFAGIANGCAFLKYNSRQEALTACRNWENEKPVKIFIPSGSMRSKVCELEIEARQVLGRQIEKPIQLKVYTEEILEKEMKIKKYFKY
jgi:hypothetical protein